jgi:hypothetical protein
MQLTTFGNENTFIETRELLATVGPLFETMMIPPQQDSRTTQAIMESWEPQKVPCHSPLLPNR